MVATALGMTVGWAALGAAVAIGSAGLHIVGYSIYIRAELSRTVQPNATSWLLWAVGGTITLAVYEGVAFDWAKLLLPATCVACSLIVVGLAAKLGRFRKPDKWDVLIALSDCAVLALWLRAPLAKYAYGAMLLDVALTFVPIARSTFAAPEEEVPVAWAVWTCAYAGMAVSVALRWEGFAPLALPLLYAVLHGMIGVLASRGGRSVSSSSSAALNGTLGAPSIMSRR